MSVLSIPLLLIGCLFAGIEIFMPGIGILAVLGLICIVASATLTIIYFPFGVFIVIGELILVSIFFFVLIRWAKRKQLYGSLVLKDILSQDQPEVADNEKLIGKEGVTVMPLRPFGSAEFNGVKTDVYSEGSFIPKGRAVTVVNVENGKVIVKEMN